MERLDFEQCLKDILAGKIISRTLSNRNSSKIAALCTQELVSGLTWIEQDNFLRWIGSLANPEVGRDLLRRILANPESLSHDRLARFVAAPILWPRLLFDGSRHMPAHEQPADLKDSTNPVDAIANHAGAVLRGFQARIWGVDSHGFHIDNDELCRVFRFRFPDTAKLLETDSVDVLQMLADVRLEPMPIAFMLYLGGPKCRKLLLRPETYEGSGLNVGSLATYAVMAMHVEEAVELLNEIETETPGFLRTVKDAAGHNLLWYMGFRSRIYIHTGGKPQGRASGFSWSNRHIVRDLLFKAKCDRKERDVFGVAWNDVHWDLI